MIRHADQKGVVLIFTLMFLVLVGGLTAALLTVASASAKDLHFQKDWIAALYEANAALQEVRYEIDRSGYSGTWGDNDWLIAQDGTTFTAFNGAEVDVAREGTSSWFKLTARAPLEPGFSDYREIVWYVRQKSFFSQWVLFVDDNVGWGDDVIYGKCHVNGKHYFYGNATFHGLVTSHGGYSGTISNQTFNDGYNFNADKIDMPSVTAIEDYKNLASGPDFTITDDSTSWQRLGRSITGVEIELKDANVEVSVSYSGGSPNPDTRTLSIPSEGILYTSADITGLKGNLDGRLTIATKKKVKVSGSLLYVDSDGDSAYWHTDSGGTHYDYTDSDYFNDTTNQASKWHEMQYEKNPAYDGDSALGVISVDNFELPNSSPYNLELNCAILQQNGAYRDPLTHYKGSLRFTGAMVCHDRPWDYSGSGKGYAKSQTYIYDKKLAERAPPQFLEVKIPKYIGWRITK